MAIELLPPSPRFAFPAILGLRPLKETLLAERHRWPLWLPVALGAGTGFYFAMPAEPGVSTAVAGGAIFVLAAILSFKSTRLRAVLALVAAIALGFADAKGRELEVAGPVLTHALTAHLTGRLVALDWSSTGLRMVLDQVRSGRLANPPRRIRILARQGGEALHIGDGVELSAQLMPPPGPAAPGDSDFGRAAFFAGIGAVGFAYGAPRSAPLAESPPLLAPLWLSLEEMRKKMTLRIRGALPGSDGAIASAIITGERGGIAPEDEASLRDAGLAHVLAIAGLHMALMGMGLFWLVRAALALIPAIALRYPIKKWAAVLALLGAVFYLLISGASTSATRAFVMLAMMLVAILLDRPALSMRSLALAAAILLLLRPEAITEPGFQMSFAAVGSLVAVAEWRAGRERLTRPSWIWRHLTAIALTSLVASFATLPFVMFHFGRATHYAVLGNLLAMPVMGLLVMPLAALSVAAMPLGLEHWPLQGLGWGISLMLRIGRFVSALPGAVTLTPSFPLWALVLIALGGLWLFLWRKSWRWLGLAPIVAGAILGMLAPKPDVMVASDGRTVALRAGDGRLYFPFPPKDRYAAGRWLNRDGDTRAWRDAIAPTLVRCDGLGCVARDKGLVIAFSRRADALAEDCRQADLVVSTAPALGCAGPKLVLDGPAMANGGGYALSLTPLRAVSVNEARGARPWVVSGVVSGAVSQ